MTGRTKPGPLPSRPPGGRHAGPAGHGAAPSPMPPCPCPARPSRISPEVEHRFRPKWNTDSGMWNIHSGGSGTPAPVRYGNGAGWSCGVDERGAAGALPGAAAGRRVPGSGTAGRRTGGRGHSSGTTRCRRFWRCRTSTGVAGRVAGIPHRVATAALLDHVCDLDLSVLESVDLPRGSGVTARPWVASATVVRATSRGARGVESQVPVANRLGGTDRSTSLRSDGRSTSPEFVFHFTELRTRAGTATGGCGRRRSYGRKERAHRSLENRKERGFPQRPQPIVLLHRIWKSTGPTSADRRRAFAAFSPGRHEHHVHDSTRREIPAITPLTGGEKNRENRDS